MKSDDEIERLRDLMRCRMNICNELATTRYKVYDIEIRLKAFDELNPDVFEETKQRLEGWEDKEPPRLHGVETDDSTD